MMRQDGNNLRDLVSTGLRAQGRLFFGVTGLILGLGPGFAQQPEAPALAITHVSVVDPDLDRASEDMTVIVKDGRILSISAAQAVKVPPGAAIVDGTRKFLVPGLWDMHVHTAHPRREFPMFVANGVLGVRNMHGRMENVFLWRKQTAAATVIGPQLVVAGSLVDGPATTSRSAIVVRNAVEARVAVRRLRDAGADFVKAYDGLSRESYFALADEAKRVGLPYTGHVPWDVLIREAVEAGQASLEHGAALEGGSGAEEEVVKARTVPTAIAEAMRTNSNFPAVTEAIAKAGNRILDRYSNGRAQDEFAAFVRHGTHLTPTLVTLRSVTFIDSLSKQPDPLIRFSPKWEQDRWKPSAGLVTANRTPAYIAYRKREYAAIEKALALASQRGVRILAGTDVGSPYTHAGFSLHEEMEWLVKAGLTPRNALRAATRGGRTHQDFPVPSPVREFQHPLYQHFPAPFAVRVDSRGGERGSGFHMDGDPVQRADRLDFPHHGASGRRQ